MDVLSAERSVAIAEEDTDLTGVFIDDNEIGQSIVVQISRDNETWPRVVRIEMEYIRIEVNSTDKS
jgi:hypothetical protein